MSTRTRPLAVLPDRWTEAGLRTTPTGLVQARVSRRGEITKLDFGNVVVEVPRWMVERQMALPPRVLAGMQGFPTKKIFIPKDLAARGISWDRLGATRVVVDVTRGIDHSFEIVSEKGRACRLTVRGHRGDVRKSRDRMTQGLTAISSGHFTSEATVTAGLRYGLNCVLQAIIGRQDSLRETCSADFSKSPVGETEGIEEFVGSRLSDVDTRSLLIDQVVHDRLSGITSLWMDADQFSLVAGSEKVRVASVGSDRVLRGAFEQYERTTDVLKDLLAENASRLLDLGQMELIEDVKIGEVVDVGALDPLVERWFKLLPEDLLDREVKAIAYYLKGVLHVLFANAQKSMRATVGTAEAEGLWSVTGELVGEREDRFQLRVSSIVNSAGMLEVLSPQRGLLETVRDPRDGFRKQGIFMAGADFSLAWERMTRMGGSIRAEVDSKKDPRGRRGQHTELSMVLEFPLVTAKSTG